MKATDDVSIQSNLAMKKKTSGKYIIRQSTLTSRLITILFLFFIGITVWFIFWGIDYKWETFKFETVVKFFSQFFNITAVNGESFMTLLTYLLNTILLGVMATLIGAVISFPLGLLAASNITNKTVSRIINGFSSILRAVPTIVWVLIFVAGYGLSAATAVVGMTFHTVAFFTKSYSESFEEVDEGTIEALRSSGANKMQIIFCAMIPQATTKIISWIAIRSEINFAVAVVIGPAVGVPNTIGSALNAYKSHGMYPELGAGVLMIFLVALITEFVITRIKQKSLV